MAALGVYSEVGKLRKVLVHRPDLSLKRLTPSNCEELLFDGVLWVKKARWEHDMFVDQMRSRGIDVVLVSDLLTETIKDPEARQWILDRKVTTNEHGLILSQELHAWLGEMDAAQLATYLIGGMMFSELPKEFRAFAKLFAEPTDFVLVPLPNQLFMRDTSCWIYNGVSLTFFAFLGFGIITFTAKDLAKPSRQLPRAMYLALGIATVIYVAIALGVFGTLTVEKVISSGGTALAVAAEPTLGRAGYWLMSVTALFATAGATNAGLYPAVGLSERLAETGQFPGLMARRLGGRASTGLLIEAAPCLVLALLFNLDAIASIGSVVALLIFTLITAAHFRVRAETGASAPVLEAAIVAAGVVLLTFVFTTLIHEPASMVTLLAILVLSIALDFGWKRVRAGRTRPVQLEH